MKKKVLSLKKRENLVDRAALVARLNALGETRRSQIHLQNLINEHGRLPTFVDPDIQQASAAVGHALRRNEARLARDFSNALRPTGRRVPRDVPSPAAPSMAPPSVAPGMTPATEAPGTPAYLLRPFRTPGVPFIPPPGFPDPGMDIPPRTPSQYSHASSRRGFLF